MRRNHFRAFCLILCIQLLPVLVSAQPRGTTQTRRTAPATRATPPRLDIPYEKFVLKNGLTVIVHEDHKAPIVAVNRLVSRGLEERETGQDRLRTPL